MTIIDVEKAERYIKEVIAPSHYDSLPELEITTDNDICRCRDRAREAILYDKPLESPLDCPNIAVNEIANALCGRSDFLEVVLLKMKLLENFAARKKALYKKSVEFLDDENLVEDWEMEIAKQVSWRQQCKFTLEFEVDGKKRLRKQKARQLWNVCAIIVIFGRPMFLPL